MCCKSCFRQAIETNQKVLQSQAIRACLCVCTREKINTYTTVLQQNVSTEPYALKYDSPGSGWVLQKQALMWAAPTAWSMRNEVNGIHDDGLTSPLWRPRHRQRSLKMWETREGGSVRSALSGMNNKTPHLKLQTPVSVWQCCHNSRHHIVSSRLSPAWVISQLRQRQHEYKGVFCFARKFLTLGVFSNFGTAFWLLGFGFSSSALLSQLLVILCNCWVWWELGRRRASPSQRSCRDESNELSLARLPERCAFPRLHRAGNVDSEGREAQIEPARFFYGERWSREGDKQNKRGRENGWAEHWYACQNMWDPRTAHRWLWASPLWGERTGWRRWWWWGWEGWINTTCL